MQLMMDSDVADMVRDKEGEEWAGKNVRIHVDEVVYVINDGKFIVLLPASACQYGRPTTENDCDKDEELEEALRNDSF